MASIVIAQGGGPTAVINQTLAGAVIAARKLDPSLRVLGARHGVRGLVANDIADLTGMSENDLMRLANLPNSGLGTTRDKPDEKTCELILRALERLEARAFIYIGGNDTAGTLDLLRQRSSGAVNFVHSPKTIDNDLVENDHVPGFISAGLFAAQAFLSTDLDFRAMPGIYVGIIMGRHAGFLAAAAAGWKRTADDAPHLVYVPERPFSVVDFVNDVAHVHERLGHCIVSISEGVQDADGKPLTELLAEANGGLARDPHGNLQLGGADLGMEIQRALRRTFPKTRSRVDTFGYLMRGYIGVVDATDQREAFATGAYAAECGLTSSGSVALTYDGNTTGLKLVPLDSVAGKTRVMPPSFLGDKGQVSEEGKAYFRRLLPPRPDIFAPFV